MPVGIISPDMHYIRPEHGPLFGPKSRSVWRLRNGFCAGVRMA